MLIYILFISIDIIKLKKYYTLEEFKELEKKAWEYGFSMVSCTPLTRSSYHADEDFAKLKELNA